MHLARAVLCFFANVSVTSSLLLAGQEIEQVRSHGDPALSPKGLLIRSYLGTRQLVPEERAMALMYLALAAGTIEPAYNRLWSEELFNAALQLPRNWNRLAFEKNALEALAQSEPELAMELFGQMDDPIPTESGKFPEDVRAFAAQRVFSAYWNRKGTPALDAIRDQARHLGDTGQYPYLAMATILRNLSMSSANEIEPLFAEAVGYFGRGSKFASANPDFAQFLNTVWDFLPSPSKRLAVAVAVDQLTRESPSDAGFRGTTKTKSSTLQFKNRNRQLLFELLPLIQQIDPQAGKRLAEKEPALAAGADEKSGTMRSDSALITEVNGDSDRLAAAENLVAQQRTLNEVKQRVNSDPEIALQTTGMLTNPAFQAIALADVAAGFAKKDSAKARKLLDRALDIISSLRATPTKVAALFAVSKAENALGNHKAMQTSWVRAVELGEELFQQDIETHPDASAYQAASFDTLEELLRFGGAVDPQMALAALRSVQNQLLQIYLPIFVAEGIFKHNQSQPPS